MDDGSGSDGDRQGSQERETRMTTVKDLKLPETTVVKLMKECLPRQAIIAQESKDVMRRIACIFALFVTDSALEVARRSKRRTLLPEDIVVALHENGFGTFTEEVMPVVEKRRANFRSRKPKPDQSSTQPASVDPFPTNDVEMGQVSSEGDHEMAHDVTDKPADESDEEKELNHEEDDSEDDSQSDSSDQDQEEPQDDDNAGDDESQIPLRIDDAEESTQSAEEHEPSNNQVNQVFADCIENS